MKKHLILTAMALVIAAPCYAQTVNDTNIKKTDTAVEKAAREQGFIPADTAPAPQAIDDSSVNMSMAPEAPSNVAPAPATAGRPGLVKDGLPPGLVMNGPGTDAYKKKHHKKKKKKAAVEQAAPAAVASEPAKEMAPVKTEEPPAQPAFNDAPPSMPDANSVPPSQPAPEPDPMPSPVPDGATPPMLDNGPAPAPAPDAAPPAQGGGLQPPTDPFATKP